MGIEVYSDRKKFQYNYSTDVFALGVIFYRILGDLPGLGFVDADDVEGNLPIDNLLR